MMFNEKNCKSMHIGNGNSQYAYTVNGHIIENVEQEKDLGMIISRNMKVWGQCGESVGPFHVHSCAHGKANRMLGLINCPHTFIFLDIIIPKSFSYSTFSIM